jgi:hypothetical protein
MAGGVVSRSFTTSAMRLSAVSNASEGMVETPSRKKKTPPSQSLCARTAASRR